MRPHQNALCTLVYMIECIMYLRVLNRMQWVLLCTQLASLMYLDIHRISLWELQCAQNVSSYQQIELTCFMSPMSQCMILSLSQIIKIIGKYISLCNTFALSRIKFAFPMDPHWDGRHQHVPHCYDNWVAMATRVKTSLISLSLAVLSSYLPWRFPGTIGINPYTLLLSYLLWSFLGMIGISQIPRCYGNSVAMATRVKPQLLLCFMSYWVHVWYGGFLGQ